MEEPAPEGNRMSFWLVNVALDDVNVGTCRGRTSLELSVKFSCRWCSCLC
jgi:hypothetical protein